MIVAIMVRQLGRTLGVLAVYMVTAMPVFGWDYFPAPPPDGTRVSPQELPCVVALAPAHYDPFASDAEQTDWFHVIGVDGKRCYDQASFDILRDLSVGKQNIRLAEVRDGVVRTTVLNATAAESRLRYRKSEGPDILAVLKSLEIEEPLLRGGSPEETGVAKEPMNEVDHLAAKFGLAIQRPTKVADARRAMLKAFPARGKAEIYRLGRTDGAGTRVWIQELLQVYLELRQEQFAAAEKRALAMPPLPASPFLSDLLAFYRVVAVERPTITDGKLNPSYAVDTLTFMMVYPFPWLDYDLHCVLPQDPEFSEGVMKHFYGDATQRTEAARLAARLERGSSDEIKFVSQVKATLVNPEWHGDWLFKANLIPGSQMAGLMVSIMEQWVDAPEKRGALALALVGPACGHGDQRLLAMALQQLAQEGVGAYTLGLMIVRNHYSFIAEFPKYPRGVFADGESVNQLLIRLIREPASATTGPSGPLWKVTDGQLAGYREIVEKMLPVSDVFRQMGRYDSELVEAIQIRDVFRLRQPVTATLVLAMRSGLDAASGPIP